MMLKKTLVMAALLLTSACDPMQIRPGSDFKIEVTSALPIVLYQQVEPVELKFTLTGCKNFDVAIANGDGTHVEEHLLDVEPLSDGSYKARVDVASLVGAQNHCAYDEKQPANPAPQLVAHCNDDARITKSELMKVQYVASWRSVWRSPYGPAQTIFPGAASNDFFAVGNGTLTAQTLDASHQASVVAAVSPVEPPLLAQQDNHIYLWVGCPLPSTSACGISDPIPFGPSATFPQGGSLSVSTSFLQSYERRASGSLVAGAAVSIPLSAKHLAFEKTGNLMVLSRITPTLLTRVAWDSIPTTQAFSNEANATSFSRLGDGSLVFAAHDATNESLGRLRNSDGTLLAEPMLPGTGKVNLLAVAPTAADDNVPMALVRNKVLWLGSARGEWTQLQTALLADTDVMQRENPGAETWGVAWLDTGVVLWTEKAVEVFELAAPHARRYVYVPTGYSASAQQPPRIKGVTCVGDSLALTMATGIRLLATDGHLKGGADPLPCGLTPPSRAVAFDKSTVALPAGEYTYVFTVN